jgi:ribosomal protein S18 acetylase RimI-like enzyme
MDISPVREDDRGRVISTLVAAFVDDPVERWLFPEPEQYSAHFPELVAAFAGPAFSHQTVWTLGDFSAVAVWLPPGAEPDSEAIVAVLEERVAAAKHADLFSVLDQMDAGHPAFPHWYLPWLGVHCDLQGTGLGGQLLRRCLTRVDADRLPAFLETPNPRTVPFYERHGFKVTGTAQAGTCPPVILMLRPPN